MLRHNFGKNKRAQLGETITWLVATIVILIVLIVSVFLASLIGKTKIFPVTTQIDLFAQESVTSYLITKDYSGISIYDQITQDGNFNNFNGNLAASILKTLYSGYYGRVVWLGISNSNKEVLGNQNSYFNSPAATLISESPQSGSPLYYTISLGDNKFLQLILWHQN